MKLPEFLSEPHPGEITLTGHKSNRQPIQDAMVKIRVLRDGVGAADRDDSAEVLRQSEADRCGLDPRLTPAFCSGREPTACPARVQ